MYNKRHLQHNYAAVHAAPRARIIPLSWAAALDRPSAPGGGGGGVERLERLERRIVVAVRVVAHPVEPGALRPAGGGAGSARGGTMGGRGGAGRGPRGRTKPAVPPEKVDAESAREKNWPREPA